MSKVAGRWNYKTQEYDKIILPDGCIMITDDMDAKTICPHCLREVTYGDTYTSMEIHTLKGGIGYNVCPECYQKEIDRRMAWEYKEDF